MNPHDRWFDGIAPYLIRHAARKSPQALSERLREEWLADLTARSGALSQLSFALGCCWATTVIAQEFAAPTRAAAAAAGSKTTVVHDAPSGPSFSRRTTVILLIVGLHVLVICVLATAIEAPKVFKAIPDLRAELLPKPEPQKPQPLPQDLKLTGVPIDISSPPWIDPPPDPPPAIRDSISEAPPMQPAGAPISKTVNRVLGGPGAGFPNTDDFYPETEIRLGEHGVAAVNVCVDAAGRLTGRPTIARSSGRVRLDEGAIKLASAGSGHYRPTTEDGRPMSGCYSFAVRFRLRE